MRLINVHIRCWAGRQDFQWTIGSLSPCFEICDGGLADHVSAGFGVCCPCAGPFLSASGTCLKRELDGVHSFKHLLELRIEFLSNACVVCAC